MKLTTMVFTVLYHEISFVFVFIYLYFFIRKEKIFIAREKMQKVGPKPIRRTHLLEKRKHQKVSLHNIWPIRSLCLISGLSTENFSIYRNMNPRFDLIPRVRSKIGNFSSQEMKQMGSMKNLITDLIIFYVKEIMGEEKYEIHGPNQIKKKFYFHDLGPIS